MEGTKVDRYLSWLTRDLTCKLTCFSDNKKIEKGISETIIFLV